jgi:hypothetical protein
VGKSPNVNRYDPDTWTGEFAHLSQPGQSEIQANLFCGCRTNVDAYPAWQAWMRQHQLPMLVVWGRCDPSFAVGGATTYQRDVPRAEVHSGAFLSRPGCDFRLFMAYLSLSLLIPRSFQFHHFRPL